MRAIVAIVGRPNVGKSTFFNRMIKKREAIVDAVSGVTRDRHYGKSDWNGVEFSLIDTGGYVVGSEDIFEQEIDRQVNWLSMKPTLSFLWWKLKQDSPVWTRKSLNYCANQKSPFFWQ